MNRFEVEFKGLAIRVGLQDVAKVDSVDRRKRSILLVSLTIYILRKGW